ncbi:hypothetical protein SGRIM128S_09134 [Streptomyces griseomycini]
MAPQRFREQFDQIQRSMPDVPLAMGPDDAGEFLYEKGVVLARDGEEARVVEDTVRQHFTTFAGLAPDHVGRIGPETNRSGITRIRVADPGQGDGSGDPAVAGALRALSATEGRAGHRLVSRNHVVSIAVNACPGDEPVPVPVGELPNPAAAEAAHDPDSAVGVLVVDTGLTHDYRSYPLLAHTRGDAQVKECDDEGVLQQYCGHGTFIAGLVAAVAPNTDITVRGTLNDAGAILESEFGEKLFEAVDQGGWPDVLSLSAGTSNGRTDGLLGIDAFMRELREQHTLLVAAAGNNASATPFWPAAYASLPGYENAVLSVGALRADGEFGACFSNHGAWVQAYAPGERLTGALTGFDTPVPYVYQHSTYDACRYGFSVGQRRAGVGVHVDDDGPPGGREPPGDRFRHRPRVRTEVPLEQRCGVVPVGPQHVLVRGPGVDRAHPDGQHLLPLVREPLGVDHQPGQPVHEPPGREPGRAGRRFGDLGRVRVGDVVQLPLQLGVVRHDPGPHVGRYLPRRVRHVEDHGRVRVAGEELEGRRDIGHTAAPWALSVVRDGTKVPHGTDNAAGPLAPCGRVGRGPRRTEAGKRLRPGRARGRPGRSAKASGACVSSGTPAPRSTWRTGA